MSTQSFDDLREFYHFLGEKLAGVGAANSPEDVLDEWRSIHPASQEFEEDVAAVEEALEDMAGGDAGIPFDEFARDFRKRHNLPHA